MSPNGAEFSVFLGAEWHTVSFKTIIALIKSLTHLQQAFLTWQCLVFDTDSYGSG